MLQRLKRLDPAVHGRIQKKLRSFPQFDMSWAVVVFKEKVWIVSKNVNKNLTWIPTINQLQFFRK